MFRGESLAPRRRLLLLLAVVAWSGWAPRADGLPSLPVKGAVLPLYVEGEPEAAAVVRIGSLRKDYERRGFFRVALLPMLVAEDVTIEFRNVRGASNLLAGLQAGLDRKEGPSVIELKRISLSFPGENQPRLQAGVVRIGADGEWRLSSGVHFAGAGRSVQARQAELAVAGPRAGILTLHTSDGTVTFNLFALPAIP
jgi:hypothetical protein